ncbi:MAG: CoA transferase [Deltaproteobacteria bacterium]|nr:CoA transferase [Deltaproteobacteria bacterium]
MPIRPLDGIFVLDLSRVLSGPFATLQLADLGADVVKVEHPEDGDDTRRFGPPFINGESTYFMSVNRHKRSIAVDLKHPEGLELVRALVAHADVVIENFRPGAAARLGLGPEALRAINPRVITCSISGYGTGGLAAYEGRAGYDAVVQAGSGIMSITGQPDGPPTRVGVAIADLVSGLFAAQGILAALVERDRTGESRHVDVAMQDAMISLMTYQAAIQLSTGVTPRRMGDAHPSICPYETVEVADGRYMLAVGNDGQFRKLAKLLALDPIAADPRFETNAARVTNREALLEILRPKLKERTAAAWDEVFAETGIPGGPVLDVAQALSHPQYVARGGVLEHEHRVAGRIRTLASPVRLDREWPIGGTPPPTLGQHTREVLLEKLGITSEQVDELTKRGAVR